MSEDGQELIITNRKPIQDLKFVPNVNPHEVVQQRKLENLKRSKEGDDRLAKSHLMSDSFVAKMLDTDVQITELDEELDQVKFSEKMSSASCKISEI